MERRDLTGTTIAGRYRIVRKLGSGGMGAVWLAQHLESLQYYALKTLHPHVASDRLAVERFLREARAAAALRSKHVVKVVDAQMNHIDEQTKELQPFLVMELLEGANLEELLHVHTRLANEEAVWVLRGVARALDVAHSKGIVHRDLKPENVYVAFDDEGEPVPKVCDFGIAKLAGDAATGLMSTGALGTQTGMTVGTPMYMSPEQARSSSDVGVESDQWAVGLIAFKLLTGREYFSTARSTTELLLKIVNDPLDPPSQRLSTLPPAFDAWFFQSCSRDPKGRFPSVGEQINALTAVLEVTAPRPPVVHRSERTLATAETVSVESQAPMSPLQATTSAPASRTMGEPATVRARPKSKTPVFVAFALAAVAGIAGVAMIARKPSEPAPAAPTASATPTPTPTPEKTAPPPPVASVVPTTTAAASTVSAAPIKATTKVGPVAPTKATATAAASTAPVKTTSKLPKGAACTRSSECASGFCVSEECQ